MHKTEGWQRIKALKVNINYFHCEIWNLYLHPLGHISFRLSGVTVCSSDIRWVVLERCMLCMIRYLPATCPRTHTHAHTHHKQKKWPLTAHTAGFLFKGRRVRAGAGSTKVSLQYGSVHLKAFTTSAKFFVSLIHCLLSRPQASQRQLALYCPGWH